MRPAPTALARLLCASFLLLIPSFSQAVELVYLKSGSTLVAEEVRQNVKQTEALLISGAKVIIDNADIDRIATESTPPVDLSRIQIDPEKALPETKDPLDWWLDYRTPPEETISKRIFLSFEQQVDRGEKNPLARSLEDVKFARKKRVPQIEFADSILYLGMDLQFHDTPGITFEEAYKRLRALEQAPALQEVIDLIAQVRRSARDPRKEQIIAAAIELRDRLDPSFQYQILQIEGQAAQAERERRGIHSLRRQ